MMDASLINIVVICWSQYNYCMKLNYVLGQSYKNNASCYNCFVYVTVESALNKTWQCFSSLLEQMLVENMFSVLQLSFFSNSLNFAV